MRKLFLLALMAAAFSGNADAQAESKHVLNYQGTIKITNGSELKNQVTMNFKIYDAPVGGKLLWQEDQRTVNVKDGFFNVYIGEIQSDLAERVDFSKPVYLEITVDNEVLPRTLISASPYSFTAGKAEIASSVADGAIKWSSFEEDELKAGGVLEGKFPNPTLNADKIKDNSIDGNKIKGGHYPHIKATPAGLAKGDLRGNFPEAYVKNGVIDSKHLKNGAVIEDVIAKDAVTADKIADGAVVAGKLGDDAVVTKNIKNGAVTAEKIADGAVVAGKLGDDAVDSTNIKKDAVTAEKIADGAVVAGKLGDDAVDSTNIKDGAVIAEKIADGAVVAGKLGDDAVDSTNIKKDAVTAEKIADGAVVAGKLGDDAVVTKNIKNEAVTAEKISDGAVVAGKLGEASVDSTNIKDGAVIAGKLGEAAVGTTNIEDKAVTSEKIAEGAITLDKIKGAPADKDKVLQLDKDGKAVWSDIAGGLNKLKDTPTKEGQMFVYHNGEWKLTEGNAPADGSVLKYSNIYKRYTWEKESGFTLPYINDKATDNLGTSSAEDLFRIKRTDGKLGNVMELANTDAVGDEVLKVAGEGKLRGFENGAMNVTATSNNSYDSSVNKGAVVKGIAAKGTNIGLDASAEGGKTAVGVFAHDKDAKAPKEGVSASLYAASSKGNAIYAEGAPAIAKDNYVAQVKANNAGRAMLIEGGDWNRNLLGKDDDDTDLDNAALVVVAKPKDAMPQIISDAINDPLHLFFGAEGRTAIKTYGDIWANSAIGGTTIVGRERIVVGTEEGKMTTITPPATADAPVNFDRVIEAPGAVFNGTDEAKGGIKVVKGTTETFKVTPDGDVTAHDATINGTLDVTGATAFTGKINAKGGIEVKPEGAATAVFDVTTTGDVTASGEVQANGGLKVDDKFTVADGSGNITASGTAEFKKNVTIGAAGAGADLSVKDGNIKVTKGTTETFKVTPDGDVTAHDATINGTLDVTGATAFTGKINAKGGIEVKPEGAATAVFDVTTTGDVTANDLTVNAVTASGEVQANGGLKVDDKFAVADGSGNITAGGTAEFKKDVTIGAAGAGADLSVKDGNIKVTKGTTENFTVDNTGNVVTKGTITQTHAAANAVGTTEAITGKEDATGTDATITATTGNALGRKMTVTAQGANSEALGSTEIIESEQGAARGKYMSVIAQGEDYEALGSTEIIESEQGAAKGRYMSVKAQGANREALGSEEYIRSKKGNAVGRKMTLTAETANAVGTTEAITGQVDATGTKATITATTGTAVGRKMSVIAQGEDSEALGSEELIESEKGDAVGRNLTVTAKETDKEALGSEAFITSEKGVAVGRKMFVTAKGEDSEALGSNEDIRSAKGNAVGRKMTLTAEAANAVGTTEAITGQVDATGTDATITATTGDALGRKLTVTAKEENKTATGSTEIIESAKGDALGRYLTVKAKEANKTATGSNEIISSAKGNALGRYLSVRANEANKEALGSRDDIRSEQGAAKGRLMSVTAQGVDTEALGSRELIISERGFALGRHMSVTAQGENREALGSRDEITSNKGNALGRYLTVKAKEANKTATGSTEIILSEQGVAKGRKMTLTGQKTATGFETMVTAKTYDAFGSKMTLTAEAANAVGTTEDITGKVNATGTDATITAEKGLALGRHMSVTAQGVDKEARGSQELIISERGFALGRHMSVIAQGEDSEALGSEELIKSEQGVAVGRKMAVTAQGVNREALGSREDITSNKGDAYGKVMIVTAQGEDKLASGIDVYITSDKGNAKGIYLRVKTEDDTKKTIGADIRVKGGASNIGIYAADKHTLAPKDGVSASVYANATKGNALYAEGSPDVAENNYVAQVKATNNGRSMYIEGGDWNRNLIKKEAAGEDKDNAALVVRANPKDEIPTNVTAALATPAWAGSEGKTAIKTYGDIWASSAIGATTIVGLEKVVVGTEAGRLTTITPPATTDGPVNFDRTIGAPGARFNSDNDEKGGIKVTKGTEDKFIVTHDGNVTANDITFNGTLKVGNPDAANNGKVLAQKADGTLEFVVPGAATITRADVINKINSTGAGTETINVANLTKGTANQILVSTGSAAAWSSDLTANDLTVNAVTASGEVQANGGLKVVNGTTENFTVDNTGNVVTKGTITQRNEGAQNAIGTIEVIKGIINATGTDATITAEQGDALGRKLTVVANETNKTATGSAETISSAKGDAYGRNLTVIAKEANKKATGSSELIRSEKGNAYGRILNVVAKETNKKAFGSTEIILSAQGDALGRKMSVTAQGANRQALGSEEFITSDNGDALGRKMTLTGQNTATGFESAVTAKTGDAFGNKMTLTAEVANAVGTTETITGKVNATGTDATITAEQGDAYGRKMSVTAQGLNTEALGSREYITSLQGAAVGKYILVTAQGVDKEALGSRELIKSEQGDAWGRLMSVTAQGANSEAVGSEEYITSEQGDAKGIYLRVKTEDDTKKTIGADIRVKGGASNIGIYAADYQTLGPTAGVSASVYANATKGNALYAEGTPDVAANNYVAQVKATNNGRSMYIEGGDWNRNLIKKEAAGEDKDNAALVVRANANIADRPDNVTAALATPAWAGSEGKTAIKTYGDIWGSSAIGATTIVGLEKVVVGTENKFIVTHDGNVTAQNLTVNGAIKYSVSSEITDVANLKVGDASISATVVQLGAGITGTVTSVQLGNPATGVGTIKYIINNSGATLTIAGATVVNGKTATVICTTAGDTNPVWTVIAVTP